MKAAAVGFTCIDVYQDGRRYATGNGVNVLFHLKKMRKDLEGAVVTAVGKDDYGQLMLDTCRDHGLDTSHISVVEPGQTAFVEMRMNGRDRIHHRTERGVITDYTLSPSDLAFVQQQDLIHTDLSWKVTSHLPAMREKGAKIYFDFSKRWQHPDVEEICRNINYGIFSFEENTPDVAALLQKGCALGAEILIATFGDQGSMACDGQRMYYQDIVPCKALENTCGAGDSFGAGFLNGLFSGQDIQTSMRMGAELAAQVVGIFKPYF